MLTNNGTLIFEPFSNVAGFVALVEVLPLKPGSVYVTSNSTNIGGSTANTFPLKDKIFTDIFSFMNFRASPNSSLLSGICS